jgi:cell division protein FtsB
MTSNIELSKREWWMVGGIVLALCLLAYAFFQNNQLKAENMTLNETLTAQETKIAELETEVKNLNAEIAQSKTPLSEAKGMIRGTLETKLENTLDMAKDKALEKVGGMMERQQ